MTSPRSLRSRYGANLLFWGEQTFTTGCSEVQSLHACQQLINAVSFSESKGPTTVTCLARAVGDSGHYFSANEFPGMRGRRKRTQWSLGYLPWKLLSWEYLSMLYAALSSRSLLSAYCGI